MSVRLPRAELPVLRESGQFAREWYQALQSLATNASSYIQVVQNASAVFGTPDAGRIWYHSDGSAHTWTIPSNSSLPFAIGSELTMVCNATANITLAIIFDTLIWLPSGSAGTRTLGQYARARALKVAATTWVLDGVGVT